MNDILKVLLFASLSYVALFVISKLLEKTNWQNKKMTYR